ncbi:hypothetical protein [Marinobacterium sp. BA1]|uniref:hypothetical protein n=1 Tax=Marinobacterium sp. BA1 TaxID=3138931 RepID=UPI0032E5CD85
MLHIDIQSHVTPAAEQDEALFTGAIEGAIRCNRVLPSLSAMDIPYMAVGLHRIRVFGSEREITSRAFVEAIHSALADDTRHYSGWIQDLQVIAVPDDWMRIARHNAERVPLEQRTVQAVADMGDLALINQFVMAHPALDKEMMLNVALASPSFADKEVQLRTHMATVFGVDPIGAFNAGLQAFIESDKTAHRPEFGMMSILQLNRDNTALFEAARDFLKDQRGRLSEDQQYMLYVIYEMGGERVPDLLEEVLCPEQETYPNHALHLRDIYTRCAHLNDEQKDRIRESVARTTPDLLDQVGGPLLDPMALGTASEPKGPSQA